MRRLHLPKLCFVLALTALAACAPTVASPGTDSALPVLSEQAFTAADGATLPLRAWLPEGRPKAVLIALHGFNDYGNFFDAPGTFLSEVGIAAYAIDQRGFGQAPNRGLWPGSEILVKDLKGVTEEVRARHPSIPLYLLGDSMGGAVVMAAMAGESAPRADGVILAAPAVWGRETMPFYQNWALWIGAHTLPWMELTGRGLKIKASDNIEMLRALGRDPLIIKGTRIDTLYGLVDLMDDALAASARIQGPALILYGEKDEIIPKKPTYLMLKRLPVSANSGFTVALYEDGYHMLLRDLRAETVWRDIAAWITNGKAPLPSGADDRAKIVLAKE